MQWIPAAWMNAVDFLQLGPKHPDLMEWILGSISQNIPIECSGYHAAWLNAVDFMHNGQKHPDWRQWIPCSVIEYRGLHVLCQNGSRLYSVQLTQWGPMHPDWMQWNLCSMAKTWRLDAVDSLLHDWMQSILCSMAQNIPIECSGFHAAWLNAVDSMQPGKIHPYWMHWIPCSVV